MPVNLSKPKRCGEAVSLQPRRVVHVQLAVCSSATTKAVGRTACRKTHDSAPFKLSGWSSRSTSCCRDQRSVVKRRGTDVCRRRSLEVLKGTQSACRAGRLYMCNSPRMNLPTVAECSVPVVVHVQLASGGPTDCAGALSFLGHSWPLGRSARAGSPATRAAQEATILLGKNLQAAGPGWSQAEALKHHAVGHAASSP